MPVVVERGGHHPRLPEGLFHAGHDLCRNVVLGRGVLPPALDKGKIMGRDRLFGERHLKKVGVPAAFDHVVVRGQCAQHGPRMRDCKDNNFLYPLRRESRRSEGRKRTPVMPHDTRPLGSQSRNQRNRILRQQDRLIASVRRGGRWGIAAHERRDRMKTRLGQGR